MKQMLTILGRRWPSVLLRNACLALSVNAYDRILKAARTFADRKEALTSSKPSDSAPSPARCFIEQRVEKKSHSQSGPSG